MEKNEVPQDISFISDISREVCYAKNENGKYDVFLSTGWNVKHEALVTTWDDINAKLERAAIEVKNGQKSPIYYYMLLNLMDVSLLASYTGFRKFSVKKSLKPTAFNKLSEKKLEIYAKVFGINIKDLKNFNPDNARRI